MFDDLKTYGIISVLLILVLGYFVYVIYRDNIVLKNEVKEIKEFFYNEDEDTASEEDAEEDNEEEYIHEITAHPVDFKDIDEYFADVSPSTLPTIEELPEEEPVLTEEKPKKKKSKKSKASTVEPEDVLQE